MIRLSTRRQPEAAGGLLLYRIEQPGHGPFVTASAAHAAEHLQALGVNEPEALLRQAGDEDVVEIENGGVGSRTRARWPSDGSS
jgi:murein endopeptidase